MKIVELKKDTFYKLPYQLTYENNPFDTIYIGKDEMMFVNSKNFRIEGWTLEEIFDNKKGKEQWKN